MKVMNARAQQLQQQVLVNAATVQAASTAATTAAAVSVQIETAVSGDLTETSPILAEKLQRLQDQIDSLS